MAGISISRTLRVICLWLILAYVSFPQDIKKIQVYVSATDKYGRYLNELNKEDLQVLVENREQKIIDFLSEAEPATIGFLVDLSASMTTQNNSKNSLVKLYAEGIESFVKKSNPENEYFVIAFAQKTYSITDISSNKSNLGQTLDSALNAKPKGNTAFFDAVYDGVKKVESGKHRKKVLIACSDGMDNSSRKTGDEIKKLLKQQQALLFYGVSFFYRDSSGVLGSQLMDNFSSVTGGKSFYIGGIGYVGSFTTFKKPSEMQAVATEVFDLLAKELNTQYRVTFEVETVVGKDDYQSLSLKVKSPTIEIIGKNGKREKSKIFVRARNGFYPSMAN